MAVTTQDSTQIANVKAFPPKMNPAADDGGRVRVKAFAFTQSGAGDAGSIANLAKMPGGKVRILTTHLAHDTMGTGRTLDLGHGGYSDSDGSVVAADPDAFNANVAVATAGVSTAQYQDATMVTPGGFTLTAQINDGTFDDAKSLTGFVLYVVD